MRAIERPGWTNLAAGIPSTELLPVPALRRAFTRANQSGGLSIWAYQRPEGRVGLRAAITARLATRGARVNADTVITTTGCTQALRLCLRAAVRPGDTVLCEDPAYYNLLEQIHDLGARTLPLPVDPVHGIDPDRALAAARRHRARCIIVCTTLSNPTGATMPVPARRALVTGARKAGLRILEDDIYADLHEDGAPPPLRAFDPSGRTVALVTSFCKSVAPGLRVGFMIPWAGLYEEVLRMKCMADMHSATVAEATLEAFLDSGGLESHLQRLRRACHRRRTLLADAVTAHFPPGTRVYNPPGGFLIWVETALRMSAAAETAASHAAKVSFAPGRLFRLRPSRTLCMRLNAARAPENELAPAARNLARALQAP